MKPSFASVIQNPVEQDAMTKGIFVALKIVYNLFRVHVEATKPVVVFIPR